MGPYTPGVTDESGLVHLGAYPRLSAQILRHRLETAAIPVMMRFEGNAATDAATLLVPAEHLEFARAVVNEIDVDDEVPDSSPVAYVARIEEHLQAAAGLLDELRTRIESTE